MLIFNLFTVVSLFCLIHTSEAVQLKTKTDKLNIQIAEYGSHFSVGKYQLICIARAILKESKILLIDKTTAHVDTKNGSINSTNFTREIYQSNNNNNSNCTSSKYNNG